MAPMDNRLLRPRPLGNLFDPRQIANLTGWYDALDANGYVESSGQITDWIDKSGSGNTVVQTTANNRPTLFESSSDSQGSTRSVINGRQSIFFDGVNDLLTTTATVTSGQSRTVLAVARRTSNGSIGTLLRMGTPGSTGWLARYGSTASKDIGGDAAATNQTLSGSTPTEWTSAHVSCWSQTSATRNLSYFLNGTSLAVSNNPPAAQTAFAGMRIGAVADFQFLNGHVGEILIYDRELSAAERDAVTRYLGNRWGVSVS